MTESATMKVVDQVPGTQEAPQTLNGGAPPVNWESEIQLVSSLAKLQELERKVSFQRFTRSPGTQPWISQTYPGTVSRHPRKASEVTHHTD